jgi:glycosyltransferase involved in cell wall biosynthesis/2-polyprenyl-3-methyl-5-hydroxy-6-metoxy-1,4-benzoquinol methylase
VKIGFVNYHDFSSNSAIHIFNLANRLADLDVECAVCIPGDPDTVHMLGDPRFHILTFRDASRHGLAFSNDGAPSALHAWTPRENVRVLTEALANRHRVPYVVHLEDNESAITADHLGVDPSELQRVPEHELERLPEPLSHPRRAVEFLTSAAGVTAVIERLRDLAPHHVPFEVISPAFEEDLFTPRSPEAALRAALGIATNEGVVVYAGNVHLSNAAEVRSLYLAIGILNRRGVAVRLVRLGSDYVDFLGDQLVDLRAHEIRVPYQPRNALPRYFALADVFVQPGRPGPFNDYRLPSKLPEFFAMGRPVILPRSNIGGELTDGVNAVLLSEGHAIEIADKVEALLRDDDLRGRIGEGARAFAVSRFSWAQSARRLASFYARVADTRTSRTSRTTVESLRARYSHLTVPRLGYATVRDFVDSLDTMKSLATLNHDLKDVQRPWAAKAVLAVVPTGGRLLEIGAGEPHVASLMAALGYETWVVDPYDGRDGGPSDFDAIRAKYGNVRFLRGTFPDVLDESSEEHFDCIYSVSVLEHLGLEDIDDVCAGMFRYTRNGGHLIHAVDHVHKGKGAAIHLTKLRRIAENLGLPSSELDAALAMLDGDPETYFLSAESHNRWRGSTPYDEFPMRRCVSIEFCVPREEVRVGGAGA